MTISEPTLKSSVEIDEPVRVLLEIQGCAFLRRSKLPMAMRIMASETSRRCS